MCTMSASTKASTGIYTATVPDVCKTPSPGGPVPIPYPNISKSSGAIKDVTNIKSEGKTGLNTGSETPVSSGDEGGTAGGGLKSNMIKNKTTYSEGSSTVKIANKPWQFHTALTKHNGGNFNITGIASSPGSKSVFIKK